ncbi:MAG TPA: prolipoprotein diacylglyceryl transferase family protein [Tepidisphaeraceae bacterium]|nr:prolipoprotein diacylglyceryl transferase family protein [Tepidisphaeraceae bacterium]
MLTELFRIPGLNLPIYSYGLLLVVGFLLAMELAKFLARRVGIDPEVFVNAGLIALVTGVIGARLSHVIENWPQYTDPARSLAANFFDAVNIRSGGLTFYGGFLLAFPACVLYGIWRRVPVKLGMDIIAPCLMIGLGFGRVGCFLNGCCYGAQCDGHFVGAVTYPYHSNPYLDQYASGQLKPPAELVAPALLPGQRARLLTPNEVRADTELASIARGERSLPVHNAQIYSTITALLIAAVCVAFFTLRPPPGRVMALMLVLEGVSRYMLEILRAEPPVLHLFGHGWSLSMIIGVLLAIAGTIMWFVFRTRRDYPVTIPAELAPA